MTEQIVDITWCGGNAVGFHATTARDRAPGIAAVALALVVVMTPTAVEAAKPFARGTGLSMATDARAAGVEAATKAKAALGDEAAKLVLVHHSGALLGDYEQMLAGVTSVFDASIVYGCGAYAALTHEGNDGRVSVLALGGDVDVTVAVAETKGKEDDVACGRRIAEQLKEAAAAKAPGRVLILFGACHIPRNADVVKGICGVLGKTFPIVGAAAYKDDIYVKAKRVQNSNIGLLVTGAFRCGFSLKKDMSREGLISSAGTCFTEAVGKAKGKPRLMLVYDCGGRRGAMLKHKSFPKELEAMKAVVRDTPIFGFYGSGEMGRAAGDAPVQGVGYHISACAIFAE